MKRINKLSAVIDGVNVNVELKYPLPAGFRLQTVLSGDQAIAALKQMGMDEYLREADVEVEKMEATECESGFHFQAFLTPMNYLAFVAMMKRDVVRRFLFVFDHRGIKFVNETAEIIKEAIGAMLIDLNWQLAGEDGQAVICENAMMEHLSPDELEAYADAQLAIEAGPRLKRELIDEILARTWGTKKHPELEAMLREGMHKTMGVPLEHVEEMVLKIRPEDFERFRKLAEQLRAARNVECAILKLEEKRLIASAR